MADSNLNVPVIIQATRLDTSILPRNIFSQSYLLYVIAQGTDVGNVANKANEAGQGAYDAQVKNDEQDVELADHDARITANTKAINLLEVRLTTAEGKIQALQVLLLLVQIFVAVHLVVIRGNYTTLHSESKERCRIRALQQPETWGHPVSTPLQKQRCIFKVCHRLISQALKHCNNQCATFSNIPTITTSNITLMSVMEGRNHQCNSRLLSNQQEVATRQNQAFNLRWNDESNCKR